MLLSCIIFSTMGGLIRYLSILDLHPFMTAFIRTFIAIIVLSPTFYKVGLPGLKTTKLKLHLIRGLASGTAVICSFYAVTAIPLANATSYSFIAPIITTVLAVIFLNEKIHLPRITSVIIGFIGMLIVLRPGMTPFSSGVGASLIAALAIAIAIICIRALSHTEKPNVIAIYSLLITLPFSFIFALFKWSWPTSEQWQILILIGFCAAVAQYSLSRAFSYSETSAIMPIDFTRLLFAATIGYFYFDETPDFYTFLGATIILCSAIYAAHRESKQNITKPLAND
ncbi:MAG: DMT family transporter [Kordiimonadaceae bacterium]|jgi:drug/metabolite transporter (DMT)-like permease|nr:DMT family transporter [Kordiimonadaceae bacterium]MBT6033534.1 DMT family transporter [Kordiimonadaceae bacterium]